MQPERPRAAGGERAARARILVVDDDADLRRGLAIGLNADGYAVESAGDGRTALTRLADFRPQLVILDLRMPDVHGMELLDEIQRRNPATPVILLTGFGTIPEAVSAMQRGAFDFVTKPVEHAALLERVRRATATTGTASDASTDGSPESWCAEIVTRSSLVRQALDDARQIASGNASVLITGESGSGKELLARAIHRASPRRDRPFVAINCAAMPENLLESELFGHAKGAFTGAIRDHPGLFRTADGGTLLLDEIGDMPLALQVKLVRVIEERRVRSVGSTHSFAVDVRVLSATHRDLKAAMAAGRFREDLFYRLNVVSVHLPPLRQRAEDIPLLAAHHLRALARASGSEPKVYAPEAMELLVTAPWPGNVRHLFNVIEQNVATSRSAVIGARIVQKAIGQGTTLPTFDTARGEFIRSYLTQLLEVTGGNVSRAARLADRNRSEFYKLLARHGLEPGGFKSRLLPNDDSAIAAKSIG